MNYILRGVVLTGNHLYPDSLYQGTTCTQTQATCDDSIHYTPLLLYSILTSSSVSCARTWKCMLSNRLNRHAILKDRKMEQYRNGLLTQFGRRSAMIEHIRNSCYRYIFYKTLFPQAANLLVLVNRSRNSLLRTFSKIWKPLCTPHQLSARYNIGNVYMSLATMDPVRFKRYDIGDV